MTESRFVVDGAAGRGKGGVAAEGHRVSEVMNVFWNWVVMTAVYAY